MLYCDSLKSNKTHATVRMIISMRTSNMEVQEEFNHSSTKIEAILLHGTYKIKKMVHTNVSRDRERFHYYNNKKILRSNYSTRWK
jgi:hypothetical protein